MPALRPTFRTRDPSEDDAAPLYMPSRVLPVPKPRPASTSPIPCTVATILSRTADARVMPVYRIQIQPSSAHETHNEGAGEESEATKSTTLEADLADVLTYVSPAELERFENEQFRAYRQVERDLRRAREEEERERIRAKAMASASASAAPIAAGRGRKKRGRPRRVEEASVEQVRAEGAEGTEVEAETEMEMEADVEETSATTDAMPLNLQSSAFVTASALGEEGVEPVVKPRRRGRPSKVKARTVDVSQERDRAALLQAFREKGKVDVEAVRRGMKSGITSSESEGEDDHTTIPPPGETRHPESLPSEESSEAEDETQHAVLSHRQIPHPARSEVPESSEDEDLDGPAAQLQAESLLRAFAVKPPPQQRPTTASSVTSLSRATSAGASADRVRKPRRKKLRHARFSRPTKPSTSHSAGRLAVGGSEEEDEDIQSEIEVVDDRTVEEVEWDASGRGLQRLGRAALDS